MTASSESGIGFDPHDPRYVDEGVPFDKLARIRADQPVYRTPAGDWYLSRYQDVEAALKDVATFRADLGPMTGIPEGVSAIPSDQHYLSEITEPRHGAVRRLFNAALASHRVRAIQSTIETECHRLVDGLLDADPGDLHGGYAMPIPAFAMSYIMGLGPEAAPLFMRWSMDGTMMSRPSSPGAPPEGPASHLFFAARLAAQRALPEPTSHLFKVLIEASIDDRPLTDREIVTQLHFMIQAGVHTTRSLLAHLMNRLVQDPSLFSQLAAAPELVPRFVEESLRRDSPVQATPRLCTRDTEFAGATFLEGETVMMGIGSANWDESVYEDSETFRLDRPDPRHHLGFGAGPHVCPGAALARLEAVTAVGVIIKRARELRSVPDATYPPLPGSLGHQPIPAHVVPRLR